jgi:hypothetical protein
MILVFSPLNVNLQLAPFPLISRPLVSSPRPSDIPTCGRSDAPTPSLRNLCALSVSALFSSFFFVFFNLQHFNLQTFKHLPVNSHGIKSFADPHPLTPLGSYRFKNIGVGSGPLTLHHSSRARHGGRDLLLPHLVISLLRYIAPASHHCFNLPKG